MDVLTSSEVLGGVAMVSVAMLLSSVVAIPWLVCRLPEDYLCDPDAPSRRGGSEPGQLGSLVKRTLRNACGALLVLFGVLMLVLPGQGLLTILVGLTLLDFPQKRRLLARLLARPRVLAVLNSIRRRFERPPLRSPSP